MRIKTFKHGYKNGWEINFIGKTLNLRIAKHQLSLWKKCNPILTLLW